MRRVFLVLMALTFGASTMAAAQFLDPNLNWQTIETPHFSITFHEGLEGAAQLTAQAAEVAWEYWKEKLGYAPDGKVEAIVVDFQDGPNGFANLVPNNEFVNFTAYATAASGFAHSDMNSWEELVTFHEYGHIADLDYVADGLSRTLRSIFGRIVQPGTGEPTLLVEGIADYGVYEHVGASRTNEPRVMMMLRAMLLENNFPDMQEASFYYNRDQWPRPGSISHDLGPVFLKYLEDTYGKDTYQKLKLDMVNDPWWAFGSILGLNGDFDAVYKRVTGKTGPQLWDEFKVWVASQFEEQIETIQAQGITASRRLSSLTYNNNNPRWSADGQWVYYGHGDPQRAGGQRRVHPDGTGDEPVLSAAGNVAFSPQGDFFVFVRGDVYQNYYYRNDLYRYDLDSGKVTRLTEGERPFSIAMTSDGSAVIYARYNWGEQTPSLMRYDLSNGEITTIQEFPADVTIESIALSPDDQTLAMAVFRRGGFLDVYTMPATGGELKPITQNKASDIQPTWSHDGEYVLFSSDYSGVYDLYAYHISDGQFSQVTNVLTGALAPDVSPDGGQIAFTGYSSQGYDVHIMEFNPSRWHAASFDSETIPAWEGFPTTDYEIHPYDPMPSLLPKLWIPVLSESQVGAATFGTDAFFDQNYSLSGGWDLTSGQPFFDFSYSNTHMLPTWALFGGMSAPGYYAGANAGYPLVSSNWLNINAFAGYQRSDYGQLAETYSAGGSLGSFRGFDLFQDQFNVSISAMAVQVEDKELVHKVVTSWGENLRLPVEVQNGLNLRFVGGWSDAAEAERGFRIGGSEGQFAVRGFEPSFQAGKLAAVTSLEFDYFLFPIEKGIGLWPVFFDDLSGSLFVDAGVAGETLSLSGARFGFGAELSLSMNLSYFGGPTLSVGVAQGLGEAGPQFYVRFG